MCTRACEKRESGKQPLVFESVLLAGKHGLFKQH